jgi:hypothetical protein
MNTTYVTSCPATPNAYDSDVAGIGVSEPLKIPKRVFFELLTNFLHSLSYPSIQRPLSMNVLFWPRI